MKDFRCFVEAKNQQRSTKQMKRILSGAQKCAFDLGYPLRDTHHQLNYGLITVVNLTHKHEFKLFFANANLDVSINSQIDHRSDNIIETECVIMCYVPDVTQVKIKRQFFFDFKLNQSNMEQEAYEFFRPYFKEWLGQSNRGTQPCIIENLAAKFIAHAEGTWFADDLLKHDYGEKDQQILMGGLSLVEKEIGVGFKLADTFRNKLMLRAASEDDAELPEDDE